jgi:hypothetical protein
VSLQSRAEVRKLARLLGVAEGSLGFLQSLPAEDVRALREQATDVIFDDDRELLQRIASASRLLPAAIVAAIGQRVFGALPCARVTAHLDPERAVEIACRMPAAFLAEVAIDLDPRRASNVLARLPAQRVVEVAGELVGRGEYVTMGRFVGHMPDDTTLAVARTLDPGTLLRVAFVTEEKERLDSVLVRLGSEHRRGMLRAAAAEGLWPEVLDLLEHLDDERRAELAEMAASLEPAALEGLVAAAGEYGLWEALLPLAGLLPPQARREAALALAALKDRPLAAALRDVDERGLWRELLAVASELDDEALERFARALSRLAAARRARAAEAAQALELDDRLAVVVEAARV